VARPLRSSTGYRLNGGSRVPEHYLRTLMLALLQGPGRANAFFEIGLGAKSWADSLTSGANLTLGTPHIGRSDSRNRTQSARSGSDAVGSKCTRKLPYALRVGNDTDGLREPPDKVSPRRNHKASA
jgi:hypothetical protein